jgi:hypothetical protein
MALVRCPKHNVPYNTRNPRGCPACYQERQGNRQATLMRDLARASQGLPRVDILPPVEADDDEVTTVIEPWAPPVTQQPRVPTPEPTTWEKLARFVRANAVLVAAVTVGIVGLVMLWSVSRPTFEEGAIPPHLSGEALPFPVQPNVPIVGAFALVGTVPPQVNPDAASLARYDFGRGATVDVLNGIVYAITLTTPERAWNGARVGLDEVPARGQLALLGTVQVRAVPSLTARTVGNYVAYPTLEQLPHRLLTTAVRPPNGCYDVEMELAAQVIGTVTRGEEHFFAIARRGSVPRDVIHRVRVVSRSMPGPYAGRPACP